MSLDDLKQLLSRWPDILLVALVIGPIIWAVLNATYRNRLEAMREDIDRLRGRLGDELTAAKRPTAAPEVLPLVSDTGSRALADPTHLQPPEIPPGPRPKREPSSLDLNRRDPHGYPAWSGVLPPVAPEDRAYLPSRAAKEIREAMRALPPLSRPAAARSAYVGKWVRGRGTIRSINELQELLSVFVSQGDGDYFLEFPAGKRSLIESLREGQKIEFEGQIDSVGDGHISLVHSTILTVVDGESSAVSSRAHR